MREHEEEREGATTSKLSVGSVWTATLELKDTSPSRC
jgi:hypothetical protein